MHEQARKQAYRLLPSPLPIQRNDPHPTSSLLSFVENPDQQPSAFSRQIEELHPVTERIINRKITHQIGQSLPALFSSPIYKCHEGVEVSSNQRFGSWSTDQHYRIGAIHQDYEIPSEALAFQSRFQSGNLAIVSIAEGNPRAYYLALQRDVNSSSGTTQWFYFRATATSAGIYTFHIVNYVKPFSMFGIGMKPCVYSPSKTGKWQRAGSDIDYRRNSIPYNENENYYTFSFSYDFAAGEEVYFAYCYPYTYSKLQCFLESIQEKYMDRMRRKVVAKTLGGNVVELISITNPKFLNKRILYITARTHPGQTVSSFVCEAIIQFLLSNHPEAQKMRDQFIIKIVPMLNPDGVVNGSYRCSLSGSDLNRQWKNPSKTLHPEVYSLKKLILESEYKKLLFVDIHGHSKKKSSFMYGCVSAKSPYLAKELPYLLSRRMANFSYFSCNFATPRSKEGTSRITLWRAGIEHSYTYQISFCGPQKDRRHFSVTDLMTMGTELCRGLCAYFYSRILQLQVDEQLNRHCEQFYNDEELMNAGNDETNGSSSELQDEMPHEESTRGKIRKDFRRTVKNHNATEKTESGRINDLLEQYMRKQAKRNEESQQLRDKQKNAEKEIYLRQRQSFMATRVNIQQIQTDMSTNLSSSYYGFVVDKQLEQRSSSLRSSAELALQHTNRRERAGQSFGILLPNVQKNQYKRYQRPQRNKRGEKPLGDRSVSLYVQNLLHGGSTEKGPSSLQMRLSREISLGQRIRSRISDKF